MARLMSRKGQECAEHGAFCKRGGGSDFRSDRCRKPTVDRYGVRIDGVPTDDSAFGMVELLREVSGLPVSRSWWNRLSLARKAAELDGVDARLADVLGAAQARYEALNPPPVWPPAREPAEPVVPSTVNPSLSADAVQRPQEPANAEAPTDAPTVVVELTTARKRRRRRPQVYSINPYGYDGPVHPFRDFDDD